MTWVGLHLRLRELSPLPFLLCFLVRDRIVVCSELGSQMCPLPLSDNLFESRRQRFGSPLPLVIFKDLNNIARQRKRFGLLSLRSSARMFWCHINVIISAMIVRNKTNVMLATLTLSLDVP